MIRVAWTDAVTIKGTSDGLVITLGEGPPGDPGRDGSPLGVQCIVLSGRTGGTARWRSRPVGRAVAGDRLPCWKRLGVTLWAVEGDHPATIAAAQELGLETRLQPAPPAADGAPEQIAGEEMPGIVVRRTLRSGQAIHHAGHVTLIGDVNPGAEIVAGGRHCRLGQAAGHRPRRRDGRRGGGHLRAAVGAQPDPHRLAHRPLARAGRPPKVPEMASVQDGGIVVERWQEQKDRMPGLRASTRR